MTLNDYLIAEGITNAAFAARINVTRQSVHLYRHGRRMPSRRTMQAILTVTGGRVTPNDLLATERAQSLPGRPTPPGGTCGPERHRGISDGPPPTLAAGGDAGRPFAGVEP